MRTRLANDIVAEFLPPKNPSNKVIFFCDGLPTLPNKKRSLEFWAKRGYWVIHPRYRGTWESSGEFLAGQPDTDILDCIADLQKGKKIISLWDDKQYDISAQEIYIIGSSFGGATALMAARDARIKKVVCISPLVDVLAPSDDDHRPAFDKLIKNAFGEAYRFVHGGWEKMMTGKFFNPVNHTAEIDGQKVLIIHADDDTVVGPKEVKEFAEKINCQFIRLKKGGHMSANVSSQFRFYWKIKKFFNG